MRHVPSPASTSPTRRIVPPEGSHLLQSITEKLLQSSMEHPGLYCPAVVAHLGNEYPLPCGAAGIRGPGDHGSCCLIPAGLNPGRRDVTERGGGGLGCRSRRVSAARTGRAKSC